MADAENVFVFDEPKKTAQKKVVSIAAEKLRSIEAEKINRDREEHARSSARFVAWICAWSFFVTGILAIAASLTSDLMSSSVWAVAAGPLILLSVIVGCLLRIEEYLLTILESGEKKP